MKRNRIFIIVGIVLVIIVSATILVTAQDTDTSATAESAAPNTDYTIQRRAQVQESDFLEVVTGTGDIEAVRTVQLQFQQSAPVTQIFVEEGQRVQAGDVLAQVNGRDVEQRLSDAELQLDIEEVDYDLLVNPATPEDIAVAEAAVEAARLSMGVGVPLTGANSIASEIDALNAELQANLLWQNQLNRDNNPPNLDGAWMAVIFTEEDSDERAEALEDYQLAEAQIRLSDQSIQNLASNVVVAQEVARAEQERPTTTGGSSSAQQQLTQAQINLENLVGDPDFVDLSLAEIDLALAELDVAFIQELLEESLIIAPFDGIVGEINLDVGEVAPPDAIRLIDTSAFELTIPVDEIDVVDIFPDQVVEVSLEALPNSEITGVVEHVALTPIERSGITTYDVRVTLNETNAPVRVGMTTTVRIITNLVGDSVLVPAPFVQENENGTEFIVVENDNGSLELRELEIGLRNNTTAQVLGGVDPDETVVLLNEPDLDALVDDLISAGDSTAEGLFNGS